jgi:hypothetical protein
MLAFGASDQRSGYFFFDSVSINVARTDTIIQAHATFRVTSVNPKNANSAKCAKHALSELLNTFISFSSISMQDSENY